MSVYKEAMFTVAAINQESTQIYPDAADFGIPIKKGDGNWIMAANLYRFYGDKETRKVDEFSASFEFSILDEFKSGIGTIRYKLSYVFTKDSLKGFDGYLTLEEV